MAEASVSPLSKDSVGDGQGLAERTRDITANNVNVADTVTVISTKFRNFALRDFWWEHADQARPLRWDRTDRLLEGSWRDDRDCRS